MQAIFQESVDSAVSKTINFSNAATRADIAAAYLQAFATNIKGITVYRDGCRAVQVLNKAGEDKPKPLGRPEAIPSTTTRSPPASATFTSRSPTSTRNPSRCSPPSARAVTRPWPMPKPSAG
jgi:ribonucleoside-diphosphate reductase alpha chain